MRHSNTGPVASVRQFWKNLEGLKGIKVFLIVAFLALSSLVSQFTSTLLLWDVRTREVRGFPSTNETRVGFSLQDYVDAFPASLSKDHDHWASAPRGFAPVAEWAERPSSLPDSVADTGPTARALLPLDLQNLPVASYEGTAALFDARVATRGLNEVPVPQDWQEQSELNVSEHERGTWLEYTPRNSNDYSITVSLCFDAMYHFLPSERLYHAQDFPIKAHKKELDKFRDLIPTWDFNRESTDWHGLKMNLSSSFDLKTITSDFLNSLVWNPIVGPGAQKASSTEPPWMVYFCDTCNQTTTSLDQGWTALVNDVLHDTDDPALAWQALTTSLMSAAYHDWLHIFTRSEPVSTSLIMSRQVPSFSTGFLIVVANLLLHLFLFAAALLVAPETEMILERGTNANDEDVQRWIRTSGRETVRFGVQIVPEMDRVCVAQVVTDAGGLEVRDE
ncbi:uncharacterized protein LTHEOB_4314 [Lasiodiplodia theobromae]|uniref:uncharacterized protein n=1 Tax=Lasiodiplodia theobromae TaxID=45133 RepID=UPI0015C3C2F5|nr:uncharacterized protein LTHEOB_4314 [Lasiodiplodia theobromae]KAF4546317.1 hypothetical protein LTHEOB_4314 [Lasiodiplodia theobromae]